MKNDYEIDEEKNEVKIICESNKYGTQYVYIDLDDLELVSSFSKWRIDGIDSENTVYCKASYRNKNNKRSDMKLHRLIMNPDKKEVVDHKDRNGLNNRRKNLRNVTRRVNSKNATLHRKKKKYGMPTGITFYEPNNSFYVFGSNKDGVLKKRLFSINKYGRKEALRLAVQTRYDLCFGSEYNLKDLIKFAKKNNITLIRQVKLLRVV